jgi:trans-2,3-dihydro-3-hydroxyanthranilate isomerase
MPHRYFVLDVFTDTPLTGNPLAVVLDAEGLDGARMQAIAREFNLSETVFVLPAENPMHRAKLRIFTPGVELPFAGHPTVGTAVLLARLDLGEGEEERDGLVTVEEGVGVVRCGVRLKPDAAGFAEFDVPRRPEERDGLPARDRLASAVGLVPSDIGFGNHRPTAFDAGVGFVFLPVRDAEALGRARPMRVFWEDTFGKAPARQVFLYTPGEDEVSFQARMFAPGFGIDEDPATGSAAAAFAGVLAKFEALPDGPHRVVLAQGLEMGRPSRIRLELDLEGGTVTACRVGGHAVIVAEGTLAL